MRRLYILRPEPGSSSSLARARALGLEAVALPLFRIEPLAWKAPEAAGFDGLLLTSANAVQHAGRGLQTLRGLKVYAVGAATAEAARQAGFDIAASGDSGIDRLLASIDPDLRLLHIAGEDRRPTDSATQDIMPIPVYRSTEIPVGDELGRIAGQVAAVHSPRAGARLADLLDARTKAQVRLACISTAALEAAGDGWETRRAADEPTDAALLALAARLCDKPCQE